MKFRPSIVAEAVRLSRNARNAHAFRFGRICAMGLAVSVLLATAGCQLIPEARSDPTKFYVLSTPTTTAAPPRADGPVVHLKPIDLASYLRSRAIVVRRGNNEIEFREFARWGEPLELGLARVLREELLATGAANAVFSSNFRHEHGERDYNLTVRVVACEGEASGAVVFRAIWELAGAASGSTLPTLSGDYHPDGFRWDGKSETSLAAELSKAVAGLAAEIAGALKK